MKNAQHIETANAAVNTAVIPDRISQLADKYGVSRNTVLITMSITGPDELLLEKLLRQNRFSR